MSTASPYSPPPAPTPEPQPTPTLDTDGSMMTWIDHLKELRNRLMKTSLAVLAGLLVGVAAVYYDGFALVKYVLRHLEPITQLEADIAYQVTQPSEFFTTTMKMGLGIGIALAMPVIMYQLLAYVVPGLTTRERRIIYLVLPFIILLFVAGLAFGWFVTLPVTFRFLLGLGVGVVEVRPTFDRVLGTLTRLLLINGVIFELPIVVYSLIWLGVIERKTLATYRRYSILVITIIAAVVSPTGDAISLAIFAVPMYLLYELGLLLALVAPRKKTVIVTPDGTK